MFALADKNTKAARAVALAVAMTVATLATPAAAAEPSADVKTCIERNAPAVERTVPSLKEAAEFLVEDVCAGPIAKEVAERQQQTNQAYLDALKKNCDAKHAAGQSTATPDGDGGTYDTCANIDAPQPALLVANTTWTFYAAGRSDPDALSLASKLLLDLRTAKKGQ
jgi:hypothetical protein